MVKSRDFPGSRSSWWGSWSDWRARFLLVGPGPQILVLFAATTIDALVMQSLASVFGIQTHDLSAPALAMRSVVNALSGVVLFAAVDRHSGRERRF